MCPRAAAWEGARGDAATARLVRVRGKTALDLAKGSGKDAVALLEEEERWPKYLRQVRDLELRKGVPRRRCNWFVGSDGSLINPFVGQWGTEGKRVLGKSN